jgi:hypothetical protein
MSFVVVLSSTNIQVKIVKTKPAISNHGKILKTSQAAIPWEKKNQKVEKDTKV